MLLKWDWTSQKDAFYDLLNSTLNKVSATETLVICGDFNDHVGKVANGY